MGAVYFETELLEHCCLADWPFDRSSARAQRQNTCRSGWFGSLLEVGSRCAALPPRPHTPTCACTITTLRHVRAAFSAFGMSEPGVPTIDSSQRRGDITIDNIGRTIAPTTNRRVPIFLPGATPWAGGLASSAQHHRRVSGGGRWLTHDAEYVAWTKPCHTGRSMP